MEDGPTRCTIGLRRVVEKVLLQLLGDWSLEIGHVQLDAGDLTGRASRPCRGYVVKVCSSDRARAHLRVSEALNLNRVLEHEPRCRDVGHILSNRLSRSSTDAHCGKRTAEKGASGSTASAA